MLRTKLKYLLILLLLLLLSCLTIVFAYNVSKAQKHMEEIRNSKEQNTATLTQQSEQSNVADSDTSINLEDDVTEYDMLESIKIEDSFDFLKDFYNRDWDKIYYALVDYCSKNNTTYGNLICTSTELQFTDKYTPYVIVKDGDTELLVLLETVDDILEVSITPLS